MTILMYIYMFFDFKYAFDNITVPTRNFKLILQWMSLVFNQFMNKGLHKNIKKYINLKTRFYGFTLYIEHHAKFYNQ